MDLIDEIKQSRRIKAATLRKKNKEAQNSIDELETNSKELCIQLESKEYTELMKNELVKNELVKMRLKQKGI